MIEPILNQPIPFIIESHNPDNQTGILLRANARYQIIANTDDWWVDFYIPCRATGYSSPPWMKPFEPQRRLPGSNWFVAGGYIEGTSTNFTIGNSWSGSPTADGQLVCFVNDCLDMYWNNWGSIRFVLTRTE